MRFFFCRLWTEDGATKSSGKLPRKDLGMASRTMRGFSLIEMIIVVTIILVVSGVAIMGMQPALQYSRVNNAYNITLAAIRQARDFAVGQRQEYSVTFSNAAAPNS